MEKKYLLISMEDDRTKHLSEVLGNATSKKIIDFLAETAEASEKDIADSLGMKLNTVEYNLNKLLKAELIEKAKKFFWSKKGKKIDMYKLSNKSIIISPKSRRISSKIKSILPVAFLAGIGAVALRYLVFPSQRTVEVLKDNAPQAIMSATSGAEEVIVETTSLTSTLSQISPVWWFVGGAIAGIMLFFLIKITITKLKGGKR